jgi:hypothetical protein
VRSAKPRLENGKRHEFLLDTESALRVIRAEYPMPKGWAVVPVGKILRGGLPDFRFIGSGLANISSTVLREDS